MLRRDYYFLVQFLERTFRILVFQFQTSSNEEIGRALISLMCALVIKESYDRTFLQVVIPLEPQIWMQIPVTYCPIPIVVVDKIIFLLTRVLVSVELRGLHHF